MTNHYKTILHYKPIPAQNSIFQISRLKPKSLNNCAPFLDYPNFNQLLEFLVMWYTGMNTKNEHYYYRLTDPDINPTYLYWHIVQDFTIGNIPRLAEQDYIGLNKLANHLIYVSGEAKMLRIVGEFINNGKTANLSIGRCPHNFAEVKLLNNSFIPQYRHR